MTKIELVRELQPKGDIYYFVFLDGSRVSDTCVYGGNINTDTHKYIDDQLAKANQVYESIISGRTSATKVLTILKSQEI